MNRNLLNARFILGLLKGTFNDWMEDGALRLSAALAYYSIFSLAPLLVIVLGVAGWASFMMGPGQVNEIIYGELGKVLGPQSLETIRSMVESASHPASSKWAAVIGAVTLLVGAGGVFGQLKDALNTIWEVKAKSGLGIKVFLRQRLLSFGMVLVIGFLLLISLVLTTGVTAFGKWISGDLPPIVMGTVISVLSFAMITALFALIFKVLPDATVGWRHVWVGAVVTALLFELGKFGLGLYLGRESTASSYGAAAAVVLVMLWVYYGWCILFFGAEFTQVYAKAMGHEIRPNRYAEPVTSEMRAQEGLPPTKHEAPPTPEPEIILVPAAPPPPSVPLPRSLGEVPEYLGANPLGSLVGALGFGVILGIVSRTLEHTPARSPAAEVAHGSKALALAGLALAAGPARRIWKDAVQRLRTTGVHVR